MPNNKKDFSDKDFNCKNCRAHLATEKLDRQILVVGRLAIFNFASVVCMSSQALNLWQSPNLLPNKNEKSLCRYPDKAIDLPKPGKQLIERLSDARSMPENYHQKFSEDSDKQDSQTEHQNQFSAT